MPEERNHTRPVTGTARTKEGMFADDVQPGDFAVSESGNFILCECPCGDGGFMNLPIATGPKQESGPWQWNGNRERPTLEPSIRDVGSCKWHGYLKDGVWSPLGDSGK